jgi:hypothetical protein
MDGGRAVEADSLLDVAIRIAESLPTRDPSMLNRLYSARGTLASWRMDNESTQAAFATALDYAIKANEPSRIAGPAQPARLHLSGIGPPRLGDEQARAGLALARKIYPSDHQSLSDALSIMSGVLSKQGRFDGGDPRRGG